MPSTNKKTLKKTEKINPIPVFRRVFSHCAKRTFLIGSLPFAAALLCVITSLVSSAAADFLSVWLFIPFVFIAPLAIVIQYISYFKLSFPRPKHENSITVRSLVVMCATGVLCCTVASYVSFLPFSFFNSAFILISYIKTVLASSPVAALTVTVSYILLFTDLYLLCIAALSSKSCRSGNKHGFSKALIPLYSLCLVVLVTTVFLFSFLDFSFVGNIAPEGTFLSGTILWILMTSDAAGILLFFLLFLITLRNVSKI